MPAELQPFRAFEAKPLILPRANIDTDQIIPARFLSTTSRAGLGAGAFADWRGEPPFTLPDAHARSILVAGPNFGCGSSREHAPWALLEFGVRAVLAPSLADIFRANALNVGLLAVSIPEETFAAICAAPDAPIGIDLDTCDVRLADGTTARFPIDPFARRRLLDGVDPLGFLLARTAEIAAFEARQA